jgi:phosphate:Na+ symporter
MPATHALLELLGEAALLLWGVHMVQSGVLRAFGGDLRRLLGKALGNRFSACLVGTGVTIALQSSTATALMASSFVTSGVIGLMPALAVMLGANVGTALVCWLLTFDVSLLFPMLLLAGVVVFRTSEQTRTRNVGRAAIGLGLMLLALHLIVQTIAPTQVAPQARALVEAATSEPLPALVLAAVLTWAMHSSVAAVLIVASLAHVGLIGPMAGLAMVLGANLGSSLNPLIAVAGGEREALRLPLGNFLNRLIGCAVALPLLDDLARLSPAVLDPRQLVLVTHLVFNVALAATFILPLPALTRLLERLLPAAPKPDDPAKPRYLDPAILQTPAVSLANASREVLRMVDVVEEMLRGARDLLRRDDRILAVRLRKSDDVLDKLHAEIKKFLSELGQQPLDDTARTRLGSILTAALNLEHAGDIIDRCLLDHAAKRIRRRLRFSERELREVEEMHDHLLNQLRLAVAVFMGEDVRAALQLVQEKERFRELERAATEAQFERVQAGKREVETEGLHLDVVRDLKRVEAHLAAIAHPLLEREHLLRSSRLIRLPRP